MQCPMHQLPEPEAEDDDDDTDDDDTLVPIPIGKAPREVSDLMERQIEEILKANPKLVEAVSEGRLPVAVEPLPDVVNEPAHEVQPMAVGNKPTRPTRTVPRRVEIPEMFEVPAPVGGGRFLFGLAAVVAILVIASRVHPILGPAVAIGAAIVAGLSLAENAVAAEFESELFAGDRPEQDRLGIGDQGANPQVQGLDVRGARGAFLFNADARMQQMTEGISRDF